MNSGVYSRTFTLHNRDVNMYRLLRTSRLFECLQELSIDHTEALGAGHTATLDRGLLWVVVQQNLLIHRLPAYNETITAETWPGKTMHILFPRYYRLLDSQGEILMKGSSLWCLMDQNTRKAVFPDAYDIHIEEVLTGYEAPLPPHPASFTPDQEETFTVPFSFCDLNGHMNNTRYFDLVDDRSTLIQQGRIPDRIETRFSHEIRYQQTMRLQWHEEPGFIALQGLQEHNCFQICYHFSDHSESI